MREWLARLRDWLRRDQLERELAEELRFHRERLERDAVAEGQDAEGARFAARRRLGNLGQAQEQARDRWSWPWLERFLKDARYAFRGLRRSPGFTSAVVLTLGLGIGANAAIFGVIDKLMFRPFPMLRDPARVHRVYLEWNERDRRRIMPGFEYTRYLDLKKWTTAFSQYAGVAEATLAVGVGDAARERRLGVVSAAFWDFFDAKPALGRFFGPAEDQTPVGAPVVVLSYPLWQSEFGGRDVIGQQLQIRNIAATIIGVTPAGFAGVAEGNPPEAYLPITLYAGTSPAPDDSRTYYTRYNWGWMGMILRRKPSVTLEEASRDLSEAYRRSWIAEGELDPPMTPLGIARPSALASSIKRAAGPEAGLEARTLLWVSGVALIVLLIACANVANLMLARVLRRRRETSVRLALGVSRGRLIVQSLTESLILAGLGCVAGVLIAQVGGAALRGFFPETGGSLAVLGDGRTLAVAVGAALLTGLLAGLGPAFLAVRGDLAGSLKAGAREGTFHRSRIRSALLILQGALSVILLVGAGLFVQSLGKVRDLRLGYEPDPVLMVTRNLRGVRFPDSSLIPLHQRLLETAQSLPGVEAAAFVSSIPFWSTSSTDFFVAGIDSVSPLGRFTYQAATPDYFKAMGTRLVRGRAFGPADRAGSPLVVVVSEGMAARLWPGRDAVGQCMRVRADTMPCTTVIGVAEDAVQNSLSEEERYRYYLPLEQFNPAGGFALVLRMRNDPQTQAEPVRKALQAIMPGQTYVTARPLDELVARQRRSWRLGATMFAGFGGLALLVAAVGLYGVIAYNVAQRMHELGVRIALGAQTRDVIRLVVSQGVRFAVAGVAIGLATALLVAKHIQPLLFRQSAKDPATYAAVAGLLLAVALVASAVPARRAARADPNAALRAE